MMEFIRTFTLSAPRLSPDHVRHPGRVGRSLVMPTVVRRGVASAIKVGAANVDLAPVMPPGLATLPFLGNFHQVCGSPSFRRKLDIKAT
jgi:hypothetical protein